jgi:hypothetical protein
MIGAGAATAGPASKASAKAALKRRIAQPAGSKTSSLRLPGA